MADEEKIVIDQYGRQKWNKELYLQEAKNKKRKRDEVSQPSQYTLKNDTSSAYISHRNNLLNESLGAVKTFNLINPDKSNSTTYGTNKRFGFFCPVCDLSFRDNLALIDHLNSPQHATKVIASSSSSSSLHSAKDGETEIVAEILQGGIRRATLSEVVSTMEKLIARQIAARSNMTGNNGISFTERLQRRKEFEEKKRKKRAEKRQTQKQRKRLNQENYVVGNGEADDSISQTMGFTNFGTTKLNK
ncbi:SNU23 [Candida oxycetoniae]|uniref:SNU23 n=1 Tax=Candida oxycetoniae TaxID=497107 RepID=A0AAI9X007_9ASCO|nr:SNU23 [Candida oxycetoniae]KAI3406758.2 SNU23 [Candida oxycetoniae]